MAERGAVPKVPAPRRRALRALRHLFTPLLPDDYLELINPLWSSRELRGRIEEVRRETADTVTLVIRPGWEWEGHQPGQYVRVGVVVDGVFHWRAYSLTSEAGRPDGRIAITPKLVEGGKVTPFLVREARPGAIVRLGGVEGEFVLADPAPGKLLFISAGSGITPIMSMLASLAGRDGIADAVHLHSARAQDDVVFGRRLEALAARHPGLRVHLQLTGAMGRISPADLDRLCPDWRERELFASGPGDMLDALEAHVEAEGDPARLRVERFQPRLRGGAEGAGGTITFSRSAAETACDGGTPILVAGEAAGVDLPFGCREGICHTCVGRLTAGRVRDLRTGKVTGAPGDIVRTCINAPEGPVAIEL